MKSAVFCYVTPCGPCKNRISEEYFASIIKMERISERSVLQTLVTANVFPCLPILSVLMVQATRSSEM
jgi:hypothetical protein